MESPMARTEDLSVSCPTIDLSPLNHNSTRKSSVADIGQLLIFTLAYPSSGKCIEILGPKGDCPWQADAAA